ncbi:MAG: TrmH family RNA methyltransferase [Bacteroidia bacterium]
MISKAQIKEVRSLHQKKYRDEKKSFIAEGPKVVHALLKSSYRVKEIFAIEKFIVQGLEHPVQEVSEKELEQISALTTPNQVLAVFEVAESELNFDSLNQELVLALDDIRDPGNFGTIIRIADWFGIKNIICSETCVDLFNPKVMQAAMGSVSRVRVFYEDLLTILPKVQVSLPLYAAAIDGKNIYSQELPQYGIILIGNESKGISENLLKISTAKISIPKFSTEADSLNAAIATAVICAEFRRRKA